MEISLQILKNERDKYTVQTLYDMWDIKTNHQHISLIVRNNLSSSEHKKSVDINVKII